MQFLFWIVRKRRKINSLLLYIYTNVTHTVPQRVNQWARQPQRAPEVHCLGWQAIDFKFILWKLFLRCCVVYIVCIDSHHTRTCHNGTPISAYVARLQESSPRCAVKCQINKPCAVGKWAAWLYSSECLNHKHVIPGSALIINTLIIMYAIHLFVSGVQSKVVTRRRTVDSKQESAWVTLRWVTQLAVVISQLFTSDLLYCLFQNKQSHSINKELPICITVYYCMRLKQDL